MRWNWWIAAVALSLAGAAVAQPAPTPPVQPATPPAPPAAPASLLTWDGTQLVLSSASRPDDVCHPVQTQQPNNYTIVPGPDCLKKLGVEAPMKNITRDQDGIYRDGNNIIKVKAVFNSAGTPIDPGKAREQPPFLLMLDNNSFAQSATLENPAAPAAARTAGPTECSYADAKEGDVVIDLNRRSVIQNPSRNVIGPNEGLTVYVCPEPSRPVNVTWGGARGLTTAQITGQNTSDTVDKSKLLAVAAQPKPKPIRFTFAPRQPGTADLKLFNTDDITGKPAMSFELEVEPRYWGAVRFGLGGLFGKWNSYEIATLSGSRQPEVRETPNGANFELVSGFAPYMFDILAYGGRSETGGKNLYIAPFIGFGVIGTSADKGIQGLSSFHAGLEFEVAQNLSIAATFVYHRGRQLAAGYTPGAPVAAGMTVDNVTTDSWNRGFAIVLNASPSFLQFATGDSSSKKSGGNQ